MRVELPEHLRSALARLLEGVSRKDLAERASAISRHYREGGASARVVANRSDVLAYLVSRLPATFAATAAVLREIRDAHAGFAPESVLDAGAGPGTASWAAVTEWPGIASVAMVDGNRSFLDTAADLAGGSDHAALKAVRRIVGEMSAVSALPAADLVIAGFALAEVDERSLPAVVAALWQACRGVLVLIEPGTPAGFARIISARTTLIAAGATVVVPCPHDAACPMAGPDWCHFAVRLPRLRDHMIAKRAVVPFEDEKFSYVAVTRDPAFRSAGAARVLAPPRMSKAGLRLRLCTPNGIVERTIARRERDAFARLRRVRWGDALPLDDDGP